MAARQKRRRAVQVNRKAALHATEDNPFNALISFKVFLQLDPAFFAAGFVTRQNRFAHSIFNAVNKNFHIVANADSGRLTGHGKFAQWHTAFGFQADINNRQIIFNCGDAPAHNRAFNRGVRAEAFFQKCGEIISAWVHTHIRILFRHVMCLLKFMPNSPLFSGTLTMRGESRTSQTANARKNALPVRAKF